MSGRKGSMNTIPSSGEPALRSILISVAKRFCAQGNRHSISDQEDECGYHGLTERTTFIEAWFEMSGLDEQYPSMGLDRTSKRLYWSVPKPRWERLADFLAEGYHGEKNELWKYLPLPKGFLRQNVPEQERLLFNLAESLLKEDERLRGM